MRFADRSVDDRETEVFTVLMGKPNGTPRVQVIAEVVAAIGGDPDEDSGAVRSILQKHYRKGGIPKNPRLPRLSNKSGGTPESIDAKLDELGFPPIVDEDDTSDANN